MEVENDNKWRAGSGTTALGIIGTALGGLATVASGSSLLGGMGNGGMPNGNAGALVRENMELRAALAQSQSKAYTDTAILAERDRHIEWVKALSAVDTGLHAVDDKLEKAIANNTASIAALKENIALQNTIDNQRAQIDMLNLKNELGAQIVANTGAIANLQNTVAGITKTVIPTTAVCNTGCSGCCNSVQQ